MLRRSLTAMRIDRRRGAGPSYVRVGIRRVMYCPVDLDNYVKQRRVDPAAITRDAD